MGSHMPMFDARGRNNFVYEPFSVYGGNYDHLNNKKLGLSSVISPHAPSHDPSTTSSSILFDDPAIAWKETPEAHIFKTVLPAGVRREDVKVQVEDDQVIKISGESFLEKQDHHSNWHCAERCRGKFLTTMRLPEDGRADLIKSSLENGVLTVSIPKRDTLYHHHRVKNVEISN